MSSIIKLTSLTFLSMKNNALTGSIPNDIGDMLSLESLDLSHNSLTGFIPSSIIKMQHLTRLMLDHNSVQGLCPPTVAVCLGLQTVDEFANSEDISPQFDRERTSRSLLYSSNTEAGLCGLITTMHNFPAVWQCNYGVATSDPCAAGASWTGVSCNDAGDVISITLNSHNLQGECVFVCIFRDELMMSTSTGVIPTAIGYLSALISLDFSYNQIYGNTLFIYHHCDHYADVSMDEMCR